MGTKSFKFIHRHGILQMQKKKKKSTSKIQKNSKTSVKYSNSKGNEGYLRHLNYFI